MVRAGVDVHRPAQEDGIDSVREEVGTRPHRGKRDGEADDGHEAGVVIRLGAMDGGEIAGEAKDEGEGEGDEVEEELEEEVCDRE
jgi:hypothetical protein